MNKINIIQFLPYFPPHKWWLETVAEELSSFYVSLGYGEVINIVFSVWQEDWIKEYEKNWYKVYILPAFDIIPNFPVPKFWKREFWRVLKIINPSLNNPPVLSDIPLNKGELKGDSKYIIQTHTRFFLSSFLGWLFAKRHKLKWVHIEHGSDYVKLWSKFKSKISYIYDRLIWKWIFKKADKIVAISEACKSFIQKEFVNREVEVIYNWINFIPNTKINNNWIIKIWFVWRLVKLKWVDLLLESFWKLSEKYNNIELNILWDWDEKIILEKYIKDNKLQNIKFLWFQNRDFIASTFLPTIDILVNPSYGEWLPTTVLEWLLSKCVLVATDVWWTREISCLEDLILVKSWNIESIANWLEKAILNYEDLSWKSSDLVREKFDWNENIEKYFSLYNSL